MNSVALMVDEHKNIVRMLNVVRKACYSLLQGASIDFDDFEKMIDFIKGYADAHHHGKEEQLLFKEMVDNLGELGNKLITHGMLIEHDQGRLYIRELGEALGRVKAGDDESKIDVIANAVSYTNHLARHIEKEDSAVYTFAEQRLAPEIIQKVNEQTIIFEKEAESKGIQKKYIDMLIELEGKYLEK